MKKALFSFAILAMMFLSSCTKPEVGPIGPAGTNGTNGKDGTAGTNGTNGINGNANVIGSNTVVLNNWITISDNGTYFIYNSTLLWASITQAIVDKGIVIVYMKDGSSWVALPITVSGISGTTGIFHYSITIGYEIKVGTVTLSCSGFDDLGSPGAAALNGDTFRIVAISASVAKAYPNMNWGNYEEVKTIIN